MKIDVNKKELNYCLSSVLKAISPRPSHPILSNILINIKKSGLIVFTGSNLSETITTTLSISKQKKEIDLTVGAKIFAEIVAKLPDETITISFDNESKIKLVSSTGEYVLPTQNSSEYPDLMTLVTELTVFEVDSTTFKEKLQSSLISASNDQPRHILRGVNFLIDAGKLVLASTDGHRLTVANLDIQNVNRQAAVTVLGSALKELVKLILNDCKIKILVDEYQICFEWGNIKFYSRIIEGQYPEYSKLIPTHFNQIIDCDRHQLIGSLERISLFASQSNNIIKITLKKSEIEISCNSEGVGDAKEFIKVSGYVSDVEIAFTSNYLMEGVKMINSKNISIKINGCLSPVIFTPSDADDVLYLAMPIELRS